MGVFDPRPSFRGVTGTERMASAMDMPFSFGQAFGENFSQGITDSFGRTQETRGMGVVGEQPVIKPGEKYEYTSGTPLQAPSGMMGGNYQVQTSGGDLFEVEIPLFSLDSPREIKRMH